jgi:hypothetical protein
MQPPARLLRRAREQFVIGRTYPLEIREQRSSESHRHFFACVNEAYDNWPDQIDEQIRSAESLRQWALIKCGYCHEFVRDCGTAELAEHASAIAMFLRPRIFTDEVYADFKIQGSVLTVRTARSQKYSMMDKAEFQASKTAVLDLLSSIVGVTRTQLEKAGAAR